MNTTPGNTTVNLFQSGGPLDVILAAGNDAGALQIKNLADPTDSADAVTKGVCDLKLPLAGGTMQGALSMGQFQITDLQDGTLTTDAATLGQVETKLPKGGGTMTGQIDMGGSRIVNSTVPVDANDLTTKQYVDGFLPLSGGTLTGFLNMGAINRITDLADPVNAQDADTKAARDAAIDAEIDAALGRNAGNFGVFTATPTTQPAAIADVTAGLNEAYTTGDLDTEAELIAALNASNAVINTLALQLNTALAALRTLGIIAT